MYTDIKVVLPKASITANIESSIRHTPSSSLGIEIISLYHYMGTSRTTCLLDQVFHKIPLGAILILNIEDLVIESGLYGKLWEMPFDAIQKYISTHSWIYATLKYNFEN